MMVFLQMIKNNMKGGIGILTKNNKKKITLALLSIILVMFNFWGCIFTTAADSSTLNANKDHGVTFSSSVNYAVGSSNNYSMEVIFGDLILKYEYVYQNGKLSGQWLDESFDGTNNKITVINKSQVPIFGTISYDSSTEYTIEEGLDLGITLNTKNEIEPNGATSKEIKLASNKSQDYYLYSNSNLASQSQQFSANPTEYQNAKAGIVKVSVQPDTTGF